MPPILRKRKGHREGCSSTFISATDTGNDVMNGGQQQQEQERQTSSRQDEEGSSTNDKPGSPAPCSCTTRQYQIVTKHGNKVSSSSSSSFQVFPSHREQPQTQQDNRWLINKQRMSLLPLVLLLLVVLLVIILTNTPLSLLLDFKSRTRTALPMLQSRPPFSRSEASPFTRKQQQTTSTTNAMSTRLESQLDSLWNAATTQMPWNNDNTRLFDNCTLHMRTEFKTTMTATTMDSMIANDATTNMSTATIVTTNETTTTTTTTTTGTACHYHYFRPLQFFSSTGPGFKYLDSINDMGAQAPSLPRMTHLHLEWQIAPLAKKGNRTDNGSVRDNDRNGPFSLDVTFFHMRKTGGTTIHQAMGRVVRAFRNDAVAAQTTLEDDDNRHSVNVTSTATMRRHSTCRGVLKQKCQQEAVEHLQLIHTHQQQQFSNDNSKNTLRDARRRKNHVVFAMIRDPIHRFLSAVGQAMMVEDDEQDDNTSQARLRQACLDESSLTNTIECVLEQVQQRGGLKLDVHFCPMAVNLLVLMRNVDIQVALLEQANLPLVLNYFGLVPTAVHMRNRANPNYTKSPLLASMSVDDLTDDLIYAICQLYAIDVDMLEYIGVDVPLCAGGRHLRP